ncbi:MAG: hypothetical protein PHW75_00245 [Patescibacteria group bacterium]|nr:hypothetical protein [Patescibacteria group bacterium]
MDEKQKQIEELKQKIELAERDLTAAKRALFELTGEEKASLSSFTPKTETDGKVIEGTFNGENMVGPNGKIYPVPANYASKSKLVEGDGLKLTILDDGSFVFKQIAPIKRKNMVGTLKFLDNAYHVETEEGTYNVLYASVTYHKGKPGDKVTIVVPESGNSNWAVLEGIIHDYDKLDETKATPNPEPGETREEETETLTEKSPLAEVEIKPVTPPADPVETPKEKVEANNATPKPPAPEPTAQQPSEEKPSKLDVSDMDIKSPTQNKAPEAQNPNNIIQNQGEQQPPASTPAPEKTGPTDGPAEPIAEMDI